MNNWQQLFKYDLSGRWYKGNTHIHTTASDGGLEIPEISERYSKAGFDFLFITDHMTPSHVNGKGEQNDLRIFNGVEIDGKDSRGANYHVVCLGEFTGISSDTDFETAMNLCRDQGGLIILAHPAWTGNTLDDVLAHTFHGVEIYNNVCHWLNGKGSALTHWDWMLERNPVIFGVSSDDAHLTKEHTSWNGGWIMVNAPACDATSITRAIRAGNFYGTQGPIIHNLEIKGNSLLVSSSPIRYGRLVGSRYQGFPFCISGNGDGMTLVELPLQEDYEYIRLEIEDNSGKRAWTNVLFNGRESGQ